MAAGGKLYNSCYVALWTEGAIDYNGADYGEGSAFVITDPAPDIETVIKYLFLLMPVLTALSCSENRESSVSIPSQDRQFEIGQESIESKSNDAAPPTKTPMFLEFTRESCLPCKIMAPWVAELKKTLAGKVDVVEVDLDKEENAKVGRYFGIKSVPAQVCVDPYGNVAAKHKGIAGLDEMKRMVEEKLGISSKP